MKDSKNKILCIEDDADTCELITFVFEQAGYKTETCSQQDCLNLINEKGFLAIILDNHFYGMSGVDICREIRSVDKEIPVIFFTGEARPREKEKAFAAGANAYLVKPNDFEKLTETVISLIAAPKVETSL